MASPRCSSKPAPRIIPGAFVNPDTGITDARPSTARCYFREEAGVMSDRKWRSCPA